MSKTELTNKFTRTLGKVKLGTKKYAPEVLVAAGIAGVVTSTVMACKATTKAGAILDDLKQDMHELHLVGVAAGFEELEPEHTEEDEKLVSILSTKEDVKNYTIENKKKDTTIYYAKTGLEFVKLYGPSIVVGALSITAILSSHRILRKRNVALAAAYATVDKGFKEYRGRVIERFGKELDRELKYNIKKKTIEEVIKDENGNETVVEKTVDVAEFNPSEYSDFAKVFDEYCAGWTKDPESNLFFLKQQQAWANEKLQAQGYLFLNDVYEALGIPKTKAGNVVGWIYDEKNPVGDNYVDFGIYNIHNERARAFVNGYERSFIIDPNVDGNILDTCFSA